MTIASTPEPPYVAVGGRSGAADWKQVAEHLVAQRMVRERWYRDYQVRVATVTRSYGPKGPR